jgi:hypothetical protein
LKHWLITKSDPPKKFGWFKQIGHHLYFDFGGLFMGTHTSYHQDGNVFRTSPATRNKPVLQDRHLRLKDFSGWYQLGMAAISKDLLDTNPALRPRDIRKDRLYEIDVDAFPANCLNLVVELISEDFWPHLRHPDIQAPQNALEIILPFGRMSVVITVLGHDENLVLTADETVFHVKHFNSRFSSSQEGVQYSVEAYSKEFRGSKE